ncbi:hypothetical protein [Sharpea azabuensis]|uniref:hypothetical protein n=1 Tax=Sharpea azabuensis TaxID=322505 RepID=UPI00156884E1|nr:hypothetical protein [Sharpea azabuensis]
MPILYMYNDGTGYVQYNLVSSVINQVNNGPVVTGVFSKIRGRGKLNERRARKWLAKTLGLSDREVLVTDTIIKECTNEQVFGLTNICLDAINNKVNGYI